MSRSVYLNRFSFCLSQAAQEINESQLIPEKRLPGIGALNPRLRIGLTLVRELLHPITNNSMLSSILDTPAQHKGIIWGTVCGAQDAIETNMVTAEQEGVNEIIPSVYSVGLPNAMAAIVAIHYQFMGHNLSLIGILSGIQSIILATQKVRHGNAQMMIAGAYDLPSAKYKEALHSAGVIKNTVSIGQGASGVLLSTCACFDASHDGLNSIEILGGDFGYHGDDTLTVAKKIASAAIERILDSLECHDRTVKHKITLLHQRDHSNSITYLSSDPLIQISKDLEHSGEKGMVAYTFLDQKQFSTLLVKLV